MSSLRRLFSSLAASNPAARSRTSLVISRNQDLLNVVARSDWDTYASMCDPSLSCFEAESRSHLVKGLVRGHATALFSQ
jgi:hypothetical protein